MMNKINYNWAIGGLIFISGTILYLMFINGQLESEIGAGELATLTPMAIKSSTEVDNIISKESTESSAINKLKKLIEMSQTDYNKSESKYLEIPSIKLNSFDIKYRTDEYVTPSNEKGFEIYFELPNGSTMATGTGPEAYERSYDWTPPIKATSTK